MKLTELTINGENNRLAAKVDNQLLWFEYEGETTFPYAADLFLLACLTPAMIEGKQLEMDSSFQLSPTLMDNLAHFQALFDQWYPHLHSVPIQASSYASPPATATPAVGCLFSGGVDSLYTLLKNQQAVDTLFLCIGMDLQLQEQQRIADTRLRMQALAERLNKRLITVTTNIRHIFPQLQSSYSHATIFCGIALATGIKQLYIPASHTALELFPWGSHPLTDPLMANGITEVIHHGVITRSEKTAYLSHYQWALDELRVCNTSDQYNCGKCEKCIRTMVTLAMLGKQSAVLPNFQLQQLKTITLYDESAYTFWDDIRHAAQRWHHPEIAKQAQRICRRYEVKQALKQLLNRA